VRAWDVTPGVPSMGHVSAQGSWHAGNQGVCDKCEPEQAAQLRSPRRALSRKHRDEGQTPIKGQQSDRHER